MTWFVKFVENIIETLDEHGGNQTILKPFKHFHSSKQLSFEKLRYMFWLFEKIKRS